MTDDRTRPRHPIQVAARRAGLNPALLRAWERRYEAVDPWRTETRQRLYSDVDIERLRHLRMVTDAGRRISEVASLTDHELAALLREDSVVDQVARPPGISGRPSLDQLLERSMQRVYDRDERGLRRELERAVLLYDPLLFLDDVLGTMMERVGEAWKDGRIDSSHEHVSSLVVRTLLEDLLVRLEPDQPRARFAVAVPAGERHELGGFALAVALAVCGCEGLRLGADLPATTIARFAHDQAVDGVAVSVTYGQDLRKLESELVTLRRHLDPNIPMIVGGRGSRRIRTAIEEIGAQTSVRVQDLPDTIEAQLDQVQSTTRIDHEGLHGRSIAS